MRLARSGDATPNGTAQPNRKTIDSDASRVAPRRHRSPRRRSADHARRRKAVRGVELYVDEPLRGPLSWGQVELSSRPLSADAVLSMLGQMLSPQHRRLLDGIGAVKHGIAAPGGLDERFVVTARRGGADLWVEVRRRPRPVEGPACPSRRRTRALPARCSGTDPIRPGGGDACRCGEGGRACRGRGPARAARSCLDVEESVRIRAAALEAEGAAALAQKWAALEAVSEAAIAGKLAAVTAETEAQLTAKEAALLRRGSSLTERSPRSQPKPPRRLRRAKRN